MTILLYIHTNRFDVETQWFCEWDQCIISLLLLYVIISYLRLSVLRRRPPVVPAKYLPYTSYNNNNAIYSQVRRYHIIYHGRRRIIIIIIIMRARYEIVSAPFISLRASDVSGRPANETSEVVGVGVE